MVRFQRFGTMSTALTLAIFVAWCVSDPIVRAQTSKGKVKLKPLTASEVKQIDNRLEKLQETFETESSAIIDGYERSGHYERAKFLLEVVLKLDPKNDSVKKRIAELDERILERTEFERRFDVSSEWTFVGTVNQDRAARVEATGEYKFSIVGASLGPGGFPSDDISRDLLPQIPTGALMGMILTEAMVKEKKTPEPFAIKSKYYFTPKMDVELYLKVNLPPGSKCNGDLKLKLSGIARAP